MTCESLPLFACYTYPMQRSRILAIVVAVILVVVTLPVYLTICGFSVMAFDQPGSEQLFWPWALVGTVLGVSVLVPAGSLIGSILLIRKSKTQAGLALSLLPMAVLAVFWIWLSQQSFS